MIKKLSVLGIILAALTTIFYSLFTVSAHAGVPANYMMWPYNGQVYASNGMCLDVRDAFGTPRSGEKLQIWRCGAIFGADQEFWYNGFSLHYVSPTGNDQYCVSEQPAPSNTLILTNICDGPGTMFVYKSGVFQFNSDGAVMESTGNNNGSVVAEIQPTGAANQIWHLTANIAGAAGKNASDGAQP